MTRMVDCPCCEDGFLQVFDAMTEQWIKLICCHCQGTHQIKAESAPHVPNEHKVEVPPGLKRTELTREQKREHLRDAYKGMSEEDIAKVLDSMYGAPA